MLFCHLFSTQFCRLHNRWTLELWPDVLWCPKDIGMMTQSHVRTQQRHADPSRGSKVYLSRERITPRDLEPNLSQMFCSVSVNSKHMIFIYKQLKRHVAFSAVNATD